TTPARASRGSMTPDTKVQRRVTDVADSAQEAQWLKWRAVAELYHAYFTGLILTVVTRRGTADAAEFVFRVFRRQQQERFLPGLAKLSVRHLPPAAAAEFVFRVFRRQQQERFLPGLAKLGLRHLPPAVAAAQYHYLSNWIG